MHTNRLYFLLSRQPLVMRDYVSTRAASLLLLDQVAAAAAASVVAHQRSGCSLMTPRRLGR